MFSTPCRSVTSLGLSYLKSLQFYHVLQYMAFSGTGFYDLDCLCSQGIQKILSILLKCPNFEGFFSYFQWQNKFKIIVSDFCRVCTNNLINMQVRKSKHFWLKIFYTSKLQNRGTQKGLLIHQWVYQTSFQDIFIENSHNDGSVGK